MLAILIMITGILVLQEIHVLVSDFSVLAVCVIQRQECGCAVEMDDFVGRKSGSVQLLRVF